MTDPRVPDKTGRVPIILPILGTVAMLAIILAMLYVGSRLETIDDRLAFRPAQPTYTRPAADDTVTSNGHAVYVPAYSHVYSRGGNAYLLEVTLSVRNTDPEFPIHIERVRYFDTAGRQIREFAEAPITLNPLQTAAYLVEKTDTEGGSGANFIVEWAAEDEVNPPVIETVMIGVGDSHNVSFTSRGQPIARR